MIYDDDEDCAGRDGSSLEITAEIELVIIFSSSSHHLAIGSRLLTLSVTFPLRSPSKFLPAHRNAHLASCLRYQFSSFSAFQTLSFDSSFAWRECHDTILLLREGIPQVHQRLSLLSSRRCRFLNRGRRIQGNSERKVILHPRTHAAPLRPRRFSTSKMTPRYLLANLPALNEEEGDQ